MSTDPNTVLIHPKSTFPCVETILGILAQDSMVGSRREDTSKSVPDLRQPRFRRLLTREVAAVPPANEWPLLVACANSLDTSLRPREVRPAILKETESPPMVVTAFERYGVPPKQPPVTI